ncbi:acyl-CoA thioesterase II [Chthonobacter rhizosphaerae]|uniref:acyl-CoA thioesterase II n=1 Tax=Chthonobacter rhizosphaerae TaxID=2735553 RepID=UPI0015EEC9F9|nr:acyl-CoA thioesterase II [Chthonobacter rhizosphaerae]
MSPVEALLSTLDLEVLEQNLYRGVSPTVGWQRVFGGQVIAQALVAAQRTVDASRPVHSLHGYFLLPGDPKVPIVYEVDRIRDGGSFTTRRVVAIQHGRAIFAMSASFHGDEEGLSHQIDMPQVPQPEDLPSDAEFAAAIARFAPEPVKRYWQRPRPLDLRPVDLGRYLGRTPSDPRQYIWVRAAGPVPAEPAIHRAVLAYLSDMTLLDTALVVHGRSVFDPGLQVASLDHAMWFHRQPMTDEWMLYAQDSPSTSGARGFTRGSLYDRSGILLASVAQEGLIRPRA